jgi:hypothetical protein
MRADESRQPRAQEEAPDRPSVGEQRAERLQHHLREAPTGNLDSAYCYVLQLAHDDSRSA